LPYSKDSNTISLLEGPSPVKEFYLSISAMSQSTAGQYLNRLVIFSGFLNKEFDGLTIDSLVNKIKEGTLDHYSVLSKYSAYLKSCNNATSTIKGRVVTVKNFLEYCDIDVSPRKFKIKVRLPKSIKRDKETISKEDVIDILNQCSDFRLKTYVMLLAATGMRAVEALHIRIKDIDFDNKPAKIFVRGENTKTKTDRTVFLTEETAKQLESWLRYKRRTRRVCYQNKDNRNDNRKIITEYRTPTIKNTDLVFAIYQNIQNPDPYSLYTELAGSFAKTLDRIGKGEREDSNERRRQVTFHSFRRFVKTTISDLGYADYSEYFIGHSGSTYWRKKESEKAELFKKIEPYLTFLNIHQLERQGADIMSKVNELEEVNQSLRERDKNKDDAITMLSDQLLTITERLKELERKQQLRQ
jgi:integrase